jgi:hypothetical protein
MAGDDIDKRMEAVVKLVAIFQLERIIYLAFTSIASVVLILFAISIWLRKGADVDPSTLVILFGSSGVTGFAANRFLTIFYKALEMISRSSSATAA